MMQIICKKALFHRIQTMFVFCKMLPEICIIKILPGDSKTATRPYHDQPRP